MKNKKMLIFLICIIIVSIISGFIVVEATGEDNIYEALKVLIKGNTGKITSLEKDGDILKNDISAEQESQNKENIAEDVNEDTNKENTQAEEIEKLKTENQQEHEKLQTLIEENKTNIDNKVDKNIISITDITGIWERKINEKAYEYYMFLDNEIWYTYGFYYSGDTINSRKSTYKKYKDNLGDTIEFGEGVLNYKNNKLYYSETPINKICNTTNLEIIEKWDKINSYISIGQEKHIKQPYNKSKEIAKEILNKGYIKQESYNLLINLIENKMNNTEYYTFINSDDINRKIEDYVKKIEFTNSDWTNYVTVHSVHNSQNRIAAISLYEVESNLVFVNINFTNNYDPRIKGSAKLSKGIGEYKRYIKMSDIPGLNLNNYFIRENYTTDGYAYIVDREKYINNTNYIITSGSIENFDFEYISFADYVGNKIKEYIISKEN